MNPIKKRKIRILLTRFPDGASRAMALWTRFRYCHASIGLEEDPNTFYSFVFKGFIEEKISRYVQAGRGHCPCQLYELETSEKVYAALKERIASYVERKKELRYTKLGLILGLMQIPYKKKSHYVCSQFVAEVLKKSEAVALQKRTCLYRAKDLCKLPGLRLIFQGPLRSVQ